MKKLLIPAFVAFTAAGAFAQDAKPADSAPAAGAECKAVIDANGPMAFDVKEISINKKSCPEFTVELKNTSKMPKETMGHNVVIAKTADVEGIAADGANAGLDHNFLKDGDSRVIAYTKMTGDGESDSVTFKTADLTAGGDYEFFCSFPGHHAVMKGKVNVTE